jgi:8-oxo-dGTP pyrophosphatase MutT (NUDIX family)
VGEDITQVMRREVREETGLEVLDAKAWGFPSDPTYEITLYPNGDQVQAFGLDFFARSWRDGLNVDGVETAALDWFSPDALLEAMFAHRRAAARFQIYKRTGEFQVY